MEVTILAHNKGFSLSISNLNLIEEIADTQLTEEGSSLRIELLKKLKEVLAEYNIPEDQVMQLDTQTITKLTKDAYTRIEQMFVKKVELFLAPPQFDLSSPRLANLAEPIIAAGQSIFRLSEYLNNDHTALSIRQYLNDVYAYVEKKLRRLEDTLDYNNTTLPNFLRNTPFNETITFMGKSDEGNYRIGLLLNNVTIRHVIKNDELYDLTPDLEDAKYPNPLWIILHCNHTGTITKLEGKPVDPTTTFQRSFHIAEEACLGDAELPNICKETDWNYLLTSVREYLETINLDSAYTPTYPPHQRLYTKLRENFNSITHKPRRTYITTYQEVN